MYNSITPLQQNLLNNIDTSIIFNEDLDYVNIFDFSKSTVLELESFYGLFGDEDFYNKIELAEFIIFKRYISQTDIDYDKFIINNPSFKNIPFLISRDLLISSFLFNKVSIVFKTLNSQINELAKSNINQYYDCETLIENNSTYCNYFSSFTINNSSLDDNSSIDTLIFDLQINSISITNTVKKVIEMFNSLHNNFSDGNKPIKFLFLMCSYIIQNKITVHNKDNYKDKFISFVINYSSSNAIKIYEYINREFSNLECAALFTKSDFILQEIQKNMNYQTSCDCESINAKLFFETNIILNLKGTNE